MSNDYPEVELNHMYVDNAAMQLVRNPKQLSLIHIYITNLIYKGVDPKTVQYLAGHENSKTTMDIYAKVKYNKPEELSSVVNAAFGLR